MRKDIIYTASTVNHELIYHRKHPNFKATIHILHTSSRIPPHRYFKAKARVH